MKKSKIILLSMAITIVHITSIIFIYFYNTMSILGNIFVFSINVISLMYVVKVVLSLFESKVNTNILRTIFWLILILNLVIGYALFEKYIW